MIGERLKELKKIINKSPAEALLVSSPVNRYYLSGFSGSAGALLISPERAYLLTDFRYTSQAATEAEEYEIITYGRNLYEQAAELIKENGWSKVGYEANSVVCADHSKMEKIFAAELVPFDYSAEKMRSIKSPSEAAIMRRGAEILDRAFSWIVDFLKPGITEKILAAELEVFLIRQGAERKSFDFIVASGERGSMPHGKATEKIIRSGELITIDFGAVFESYATDMTRTLAVGRCDGRQREVYELVKKAHKAGSSALKPEKSCREVDNAARSVIEEAGYGKYFGHGLGHSIGLETHESPSLNPVNDTIIEPGMIITVEPGVYMPGWGGVRIEDMVLVTEDGSETLTNSERDLIIV